MTEEDEMILYHGTSSANKASILKEGIKPRGDSDGNFPGKESAKGFIYFSDCYPIIYASRAANFQAPSADLLILRVKLRRKDLYPDEDHLISEYQNTHNVSISAIPEDDKNPQNYKEKYNDSFRFCGKVSYNGTLLPSNIIETKIIKNLEYSDMVNRLGCNRGDLGDIYKKDKKIWDYILQEIFNSNLLEFDAESLKGMLDLEKCF